MWAFLKNLKEFLTLDYRSIFIVATTCWAIIAIPENIWQNVGLFSLWVQLKPWIFVTGLLFTIWFTSGGLFDLSQNRLRKRNKQIKLEKQLLLTSRVEREVLARFIQEDTTTIAFEMRDGIVNGLVYKDILYRASNLTNPMSFDLDTNIQPWVWNYLKKHPEFLKDIHPGDSGRHQWGL